MIKTLQSYIIFVLLLVAQKNSPMQTIAHNIEIPFAWNCMKMLDICMKCIEMLCFRMKYAVFAWSFPASMLYNPQQPLPPARKPLSMIPQKQAPVTVMCQPACLNRWNVYLILFDHIWLVSACALRICFAEMQPEVKRPCIGVLFQLPPLVLNQVSFRRCRHFRTVNGHLQIWPRN